MPAVRFIVSGKVQSVFYRASAREQAAHLGLNGYAKNLADGCVEVLAVGDADALQTLEQWLQRGPALAQVDGVRRENAALEFVEDNVTGFHVR
jgi:acylphosphatase